MKVKITTPLEAYNFLNDHNFKANVISRRDGVTILKVDVPSGPGALSITCDLEFYDDPHTATMELMEAVIEETLTYELCREELGEVCDQPPSLGLQEVVGHTHGCWKCDHCKRRIKHISVAAHTWWCGYEINRYRPYKPA